MMHRTYPCFFALFLAFQAYSLNASAPEKPVVQVEKKVKKQLPYTIETIFGQCAVDHPLIHELLEHRCMTRLHEIDQHGPTTYFGPKKKSFSRHAHSVGVYALLKKHGAPLEEQVAGLLHDASHTVFSHVADRLFKTGNLDAYQDGIHHWFLEKMDLEKVLKKYSLTIPHILPKQKHFTALEKDLPFMCADRIEYNIHAGLVRGAITQDEAHAMSNDLVFEDNTWFFTSEKSARMLGDLSLGYTEKWLATSENTVMNYWMSVALRRAVSVNLLSFDDIHFGIDADVLKKMRSSDDPVIVAMFECLATPSDHYSAPENTTKFDLFDRPKFRGIDPLVKQGKTHVHLTQIDASFKKEYERVKAWTKKGHTIRFASQRARGAA